MSMIIDGVVFERQRMDIFSVSVDAGYWHYISEKRKCQVHARWSRMNGYE
jgi:hypothetical protein